MAEVIGLGASIIAIVQIADRVVGLCKFYIETVRDAPSDLRSILIEVSAVKTILDNIGFLISCDNLQSKMLDGLSSSDGPIQGCRNAVEKMEALFPTVYAQGSTNSSSKRQKVMATSTHLAWPFKAEKARKLVEELNRFKMTINLALTTESVHDIKEIRDQTSKMDAILSDDQRDKVYRWLQDTDPTPLHHRACKQYESGTGNWMLRSPEWINWLDGKTRCIWIFGIPGAGKTVLASYLIENVEQHCETVLNTKCAVIYYYCYFGHKQEEASPFLRWIVSQLCRQSKLIPAYLNNLYENGRHSSLVELLHALEATLEYFDNVYIIIDAIDESMPRDDLLKVLRDLNTDSRFQKVQLLATSRRYIDIEKTMEPISTQVSMMNPLLDEDIKLYVGSALSKVDSKFKYWPQPLLDEVLEVVSSKAKGMFRWAACQIHVLERLKPDKRVVQNALANLPKTLDETYERIFLAIPEEDRILVHYALKWIYYNQELWDYSIACPILLQAIERSICESNPTGNDSYLDDEILREICGCLITVTPERCRGRENYSLILVVSFAHYSVWEFLDSTRILETPASFFAVEKEKINVELTRTMLHEALKTHINDGFGHDDDYRLAATHENFDTYSLVTLMHNMRIINPDLLDHEDIKNLTLDFWDQSKPHYSSLKKARSVFSDQLVDSDNLNIRELLGWEWNGPPESSEIAFLVRLLMVDETCSLAEKFIGKINIQEALQTQLDINNTCLRIPLDIELVNGRFQGSLIELLARLCGQFASQVNFLLEFGINYFDPTVVLLSLLPYHIQDNYLCSEDYCVVLHLLQLGANPNGSKYRVTPLQIAVKCDEFEALKLLLEAGADPNGMGDSSGIEWEDGNPLNRFNELHGHTPLEILRDLKSLSITRRNNKKIKKVLLEYGAKPYPKDSDERDEEDNDTEDDNDDEGEDDDEYDEYDEYDDDDDEDDDEGEDDNEDDDDNDERDEN